MKKRVNISIGAELHQRAVEYAKAREMDFSELLSSLVRRELEASPASASPVEASKRSRKRQRVVLSAAHLARVVESPVALRPGRNAPCPCGSGRKFKRCCMDVRAV